MIQKNLKKESINSSFKGFTLMELIVGIIIASIATLAILYSVLYVQSSSYEMRIIERAYEELKSYTDLLKARIAGNDIPESGATNLSRDVCLDKNESNVCVNEGTVTARIINPIGIPPSSISQRKGLKTKIAWDTRSGSEKVIEFYVEQLILSSGDSND